MRYNVNLVQVARFKSNFIFIIVCGTAVTEIMSKLIKFYRHPYWPSKIISTVLVKWWNFLHSSSPRFDTFPQNFMKFEAISRQFLCISRFTNETLLLCTLHDIVLSKFFCSASFWHTLPKGYWTEFYGLDMTFSNSNTRMKFARINERGTIEGLHKCILSIHTFDYLFFFKLSLFFFYFASCLLEEDRWPYQIILFNNLIIKLPSRLTRIPHKIFVRHSKSNRKNPETRNFLFSLKDCFSVSFCKIQSQ